MKRSIVIILAAMIAMAAFSKNIPAPDFAFPKTVIKQSGERLERAIKSDDGKGAVAALVELTIARSRIDSKNITESLVAIADTRSKISDATARAMLDMLRAELLTAFYMSDPWSYNSRKLPLTPLADSPTQWSGEQFRHEITQAIDHALHPRHDLKQAKLQQWANIVTTSTLTALYYPTLLDFIGSRSLTLLTDIDEIGDVVPVSALDTDIDLAYAPALRIQKIYRTLIDAHTDGTAPRINYTLKYLSFLAGHTYRSNDTEIDAIIKRRLQNMYNRSASGSEYSGDILIAFATTFAPYLNMDNNSHDRIWLYNVIKSNLKRYPAYERRNCLRQQLADIEKPSLKVRVPQSFAPGSPVTLEVDAANITNGTILICRVKDAAAKGVKLTDAVMAAKVGEFAVSVGDTVPCYGHMRLQFTFPDEGQYIVVPTFPGSEKGNMLYTPVYCTRLALSTTTFTSRPTAWTIDGIDGRPLGGVDLLAISSKGLLSALGTSADNGAVTIDRPDFYGSIVARLGDSLTPSLWVSGGGNNASTDKRRYVNVYTALPLYHPGDSVDWSAICYFADASAASLAADTQLTATLFDANGMKVDDVECVTDAYGRITGRFSLPTGGLQGTFRIRVSTENTTENGVAYFNVSDYQLPEFAIEMQPTTTLPDGSIELHGRVRSYSGFPMASSRVNVSVSALPRARWWNVQPSEPFFDTTLNIDAKGDFSITLHRSVLDGSPAPDGAYLADISVTSPTGESHRTTQTFARGKLMSLYAEMAAATDLARPANASLKVLDASNNPLENIRLDYTISRNDSIVRRGNTVNSDGHIDIAGLRQGRIGITFTLPDKSDSATVQTVLYDPKSTESPIESDVLWTPATATEIASNQIELLVAAPHDTHILATLTTATGTLVSQQWIAFPAGMRRIQIPVTEKIESKAKLNLSAIAHYNSSSIDIDVTNTANNQAIRIIAESMRDHLTPGNVERWSFRVTGDDDAGTQAAMMLDMWNAAINPLAQNHWPTGFYHSYIGAFSYSTAAHANVNEEYAWGVMKRFNCPYIEAPRLQTYGLPLTPMEHRLMTMSRTGALYANMESTDAVMSAMTKEEAVAAESAPESDAGTPGGAESPEPEFAYRDSEVPLAFFRPLLVTDPDGTLSFSFEVPNANTTWQLRAMAFTQNLLSATLERTFTASKPVMVRPNLPRFLRQGDRAELPALVMNNTGMTQNVITSIEIFNPATGAITAHETQTHTLAPGSSETAIITVDAPDTLAALGYRVKSSIDNFADGEQSLIPILNNSQRIIESEPFYIPEGVTAFSERLPDLRSGDRLIVEYCSNPAWYVIQALPGLTTESTTTAIGASAGIFSAAVADGILRTNPAIAMAVKEWTQSNRSDSTLSSMLNRNPDLKVIMLKATPWMSDAATDTERMERLALLFDRKSIEATLESSITALSKLSDGGWRWVAAYDEPSMWATVNVLTQMGMLNTSGWLPSDSRLTSMIESAIKWLDNEIAEQYRKAPGGNYMSYTYLRDMFPAIRQSSAAERVSSATVQQVIGRWRDLDIVDKAIAAMILEAHNYHSTAEQVIESLREYAVSSSEKGLWWPSLEQGWQSYLATAATAVVLDAFTAVAPASPDIDAIRQWIVLQKQAQNWGNSINASRIVASFVKSSTRWLKPARPVTLSIAGQEIDTDTADNIAGYIRADISDKSIPGAELSIAGCGQAPSWGAVFAIGDRNMEAIEAASVPDLSIEKHYYIVNPDGSTVNANGRLTTGQRVRVSLSLEVKRTIDYVTITDNRPACFEPVDQLAGWVWSDATSLYRVNADTTTDLFARRLTPGSYIFSYDMWVTAPGVYTAGAATVQSQYAPALTAHSSGSILTVNP